MSSKRFTIDFMMLNHVITYVSIFVFLTSSTTSMGTYLSKSDSSEKAPPYLKEDRDVMNYLKMYQTDVMLWRCKNAITRTWTGQPFDYIELYCEVLGRVKTIDLFHNWKKVPFDQRIQLIASPHHANGKVYAYWMDFRIRINHATKKDAGSYIVRVKSPLGNRESQVIFLDISKKHHTYNPAENETLQKRRERKIRRRKMRRMRRRKKKRARARA